MPRKGQRSKRQLPNLNWGGQLNRFIPSVLCFPHLSGISLSVGDRMPLLKAATESEVPANKGDCRQK